MIFHSYVSLPEGNNNWDMYGYVMFIFRHVIILGVSENHTWIGFSILPNI